MFHCVKIFLPSAEMKMKCYIHLASVKLFAPAESVKNYFPLLNTLFLRWLKPESSPLLGDLKQIKFNSNHSHSWNRTKGF